MATNPRGRDRTQLSRNATSVATLGGLEPPRFGNAAHDRWAEAVNGRLGALAGNRTRWDKAVTHRELEDRLESLGVVRAGTVNGTPPAGVPVIGPNGQQVVLGWDAFAANIAGTKLYADLQRSINDPARFSELIPRFQEVLTAELGAITGRIGAEVKRWDEALSSATESFALTVQEVEAKVENAAAGVRRVSAASASRTRAVATDVTTVTAGLADMGGEDPGTATVEQIMLAVADRWDGLRAQYTIKVAANGAMAGIGIAATDTGDGNATSHVIIMADKFAVVGSGDTLGGSGTVGDPYTPPAGRVPFGVDTGNNTVYVDGTLRVGSGTGSRIDSVGKRIVLTAPTNAFIIDRAGTAAPTSIVITATRLNGLTGTTTWTVVNGTATLSSTGNTSATLTNANLTTDTATIQASVTMDSITYTAQFTINRSYNSSRGAVQMNGNAYGINSTSWSDGIANRVVRNAVMGESLTTSLASDALNKVGDTVTLSANDGSFASTKYWSASGGGTWVTAAAYIHGNLFVSGTVTASAVDVSTDIVVEGQGLFNGSTDGGAYGDFAVVGNADFNAVSGVLGYASGSGSRYGVVGVGASGGSHGVYGAVGTGAGNAVMGANAGSGAGVYGAGNTGPGVLAEGGTGPALRATANASSNVAIDITVGYLKQATANYSAAGSSGTATFDAKIPSNNSTTNQWCVQYKGTTKGWVPWWPDA